MRRIDVALGERSYPVLLGNGLLDQAAEPLRPYTAGGRLVVVTDQTIWSLWGDKLTRGIGGIKVQPIVLPPGEETKSWPALSGLIDDLLALGVDRSGHIVAFGGGVIGDLTGFAAAILKRGVGYVQIPTTLLAHVDSSVGGKTAINVAAGKNLVGAFHQPSMVLIDPQVLNTLPERQLRAGYAEVVKYGLIGDRDFFAWCEANSAALLSGDAEARLHATETSIRAKAAIVADDERETSGRRALLNLGHTFGHALEAEAGFSDALLHGEAVAIGMALAFRFSAERGLCSPQDAERVDAHLQTVGLPTRIGNASAERLLERMGQDKKNSGSSLTLILARGIGKAFVERDVKAEEVSAFLSREARC
ncbi:MAG TPA: 3-dehydroquinate synthase [Allosphingosinicella sp.]|uniref:3-dehydroquinate synthase n=1 Tax=Allosphingosinicella sp. TaxID=2823234 RepID=UPI002ED82B72